MDQSSNSKNILIFGGNGFIGSHAVLKFLEAGNFDWDTRETIESRVKIVKLDRKNAESPELLSQYLSEKNVKFRAVIDFSAYKLKFVKPYYAILKQHCSKYVYISTDSIYEVCKNSTSTNGITESEAIRPTNHMERQTLNKADSYGHEKLKIEEYLRDEAQNGGLMYLILRLPDVLGERDGTERLCQYIIWMMHVKVIDRKVDLPMDICDKQLSFVDVKDVANVIFNVVEKESLVNETFNVSYAQLVSLRQLLKAMCLALGLQCDEVLCECVDKTGVSFYPSVGREHVNIDKINTILHFQPNDFDSSIIRVINFYTDAFTRFPHEIRYGARSLSEELELTKTQRKVLMRAVESK